MSVFNNFYCGVFAVHAVGLCVSCGCYPSSTRHRPSQALLPVDEYILYTLFDFLTNLPLSAVISVVYNQNHFWEFAPISTGLRTEHYVASDVDGFWLQQVTYPLTSVNPAFMAG